MQLGTPGSEQLRRIITPKKVIVPLKMSLGSSHVKLRISPSHGGLDNAVITEVLTWKIKFSVNGRLLSSKCNRKFYF